MKFHWIGSPEQTNRGCFARSDIGINRPEDLYERELLVGTDGAGTSLSEMPVLLKNLLGMKFRTVDGYKGSNDIVLAMQRNEVGGICQTVTAFSQSAQPMLDAGTFRILFTTERERVPTSRCRPSSSTPRPTKSAPFSSSRHPRSRPGGLGWRRPACRQSVYTRCAAPSMRR